MKIANEPLAAFIKSCQAFIKIGDSATIGQGLLRGPAAVWKSVCHEASMVPVGDSILARQFFEHLSCRSAWRITVIPLDYLLAITNCCSTVRASRSVPLFIPFTVCRKQVRPRIHVHRLIRERLMAMLQCWHMWMIRWRDSFYMCRVPVASSSIPAGRFT